MDLPDKAERLCIYTGESDVRQKRPVFELLVEEARRRGLAGATVMRGVSGFGANSRVHTAKVLRLSEDLPVVVEIIDAPEKIEAFLDFVNLVLSEGLVTREPVRVHFYRHNHGGKRD